MTFASVFSGSRFGCGGNHSTQHDEAPRCRLHRALSVVSGVCPHSPALRTTGRDHSTCHDERTSGSRFWPHRRGHTERHCPADTDQFNWSGRPRPLDTHQQLLAVGFGQQRPGRGRKGKKGALRLSRRNSDCRIRGFPTTLWPLRVRTVSWCHAIRVRHAQWRLPVARSPLARTASHETDRRIADDLSQVVEGRVRRCAAVRFSAEIITGNRNKTSGERHLAGDSSSRHLSEHAQFLWWYVLGNCDRFLESFRSWMKYATSEITA